MKIGHLDTSERVVIVAEIGVNHEGNMEVAHELIGRAADAGADAVKFQVYHTDLYVDPADTERYERMKRFELRPGEFTRLANDAHRLGLAFIATPFDLPSADLCIRICDAVKIASKDIDLWPLLERVVRSDKPMIVSTGMSDVVRVQKMLKWIYAKRGPLREQAVLHCVSGYPVPYEQAQLREIQSLKSNYGFIAEVGYSDHTIGIDAAPLAVALGARIIEKHFTLDHNYSDFRDHAISATPDEFALLVQRVRAAEIMLGEPVKRVQPCEQDTIEACERERAFRVSRLTC